MHLFQTICSCITSILGSNNFTCTSFIRANASALLALYEPPNRDNTCLDIIQISEFILLNISEIFSPRSLSLGDEIIGCLGVETSIACAKQQGNENQDLNPVTGWEIRILKESMHFLYVQSSRWRKMNKNLGSKKASSGVSPSGDGWGRKRRHPKKAMEWSNSPETTMLRRRSPKAC